MNGRVYDYNLGRFLSVDPFIQEPGNSQSMNPYSYIMNNPLAGTDPSGYKSKSICEGTSAKCSVAKSDAEKREVLNKLTEDDNGSESSTNASNDSDKKGADDIDPDKKKLADSGLADFLDDVQKHVSVPSTGATKRASFDASGTSGNQASFNDEQLGNIANYFKDEDYAGAYSYILGEIQGLDAVDDDTKYWFEKAIEINTNQDTPANTWIRAFTTKGLALDGITATPEMLQGISDSIAQNVISDVLRSGGVPQFNQLVVSDIRVALSNGGQTIGGWGGSSYFWNLPYGSNNETVGQLIKGNSYELNKFRQSYSHAVKTVFGKHGFGAVKEASRTFNMGSIQADLACGLCLFEF
jgi:hypothetical protein